MLDHIHNETVLTFLQMHNKNSAVKKYIAEQQTWIDEINAALDTKYKGYLDYLEANIGDDADFTMDELQELLGGE